MSTVTKNQIQGWKEIAAYLGRDERTAKRWEKSRGMPVRRIPGSGRANVYIVVADLESWLARDAPPAGNAGSLPAHPPFPAASAPPAIDPPPSNSFAPATLVSSPGKPPLRLSRLSLAMLSLAMISVISLAAYALRSPLRSRLGAPPAALSASLTHPVYRSPVPGLDDLYLQGKFFLEERTPASLEAARSAFAEITARDRSYAPAFAGLAVTYLLEREYASMSEREAYERARTAAERALALDPRLPDAHASLGFIDFFADWNSPQATHHFQSAIQLDPNCVLAHHWYGSMLTHQARFPQAIAELNIAQHLEPASTSILASRAYALGLSGQHDTAIGMLKSVIGTSPQEAPPHPALANLSLTEPRDIPQYLEQLREFAAIRHSPGTAEFAALGSKAYQRGGERAFWLELRQQATRSPAEHRDYLLVRADAQLGIVDEAFQTLDRMVDRHDYSVVGILIDTSLSPLRRDARFPALIRRIGAFDTPRQNLQPESRPNPVALAESTPPLR